MREFNTELLSEQVKIDDRFFEIRELTTGAKNNYFRAVGKSMEVRLISTGEYETDGKDKKEKMRREVLFKDMTGNQIEILANTMFEIANGVASPVSRELIGSWGSKLTEELAKIAFKLNGMNISETEKKEEARKN